MESIIPREFHHQAINDFEKKLLKEKKQYQDKRKKYQNLLIQYFNDVCDLLLSSNTETNENIWDQIVNNTAQTILEHPYSGTHRIFGIIIHKKHKSEKYPKFIYHINNAPLKFPFSNKEHNIICALKFIDKNKLMKKIENTNTIFDGCTIKLRTLIFIGNRVGIQFLIDTHKDSKQIKSKKNNCCIY